MTPRIKKLIGAFVILLWLPIYTAVAIHVARNVLPHAHWTVVLLYYALAGTLWIIPVGLMFPWMYREPNRS